MPSNGIGLPKGWCWIILLSWERPWQYHFGSHGEVITYANLDSTIDWINYSEIDQVHIKLGLLVGIVHLLITSTSSSIVAELIRR